MTTLEELVRFSLAMHLHIDPASLENEQRLATDLDLMPIDLVWIAMRVEALELGTREFPMETLTELATVADFVRAFEDWAAQRDTFEQIDVYDLEPNSAPASIR